MLSCPKWQKQCWPLPEEMHPKVPPEHPRRRKPGPGASFLPSRFLLANWFCMNRPLGPDVLSAVN